MASGLKKFLWPTFEKFLVFLVFAFLIIPAAYYFSKNGIYCYPSTSTPPAPDTCELAQLSYGTWHASWFFIADDIFEGVPLIPKGRFSSAMALLTVPFFGALLSYLLSCSLVHFLEPKLA